MLEKMKMADPGENEQLMRAVEVDFWWDSVSL
jgi:hypothetical protein